MFVATSLNVPASGSIQRFALKPSSLKTQRLAPSAPCAFIGQKNRNASNTSNPTKRGQGEDSALTNARMASADNKRSTTKDSEKKRAAPRAVEGTNLFSMDDDYSFLTVEDLLTA
jgi:hypothetical protein